MYKELKEIVIAGGRSLRDKNLPAQLDAAAMLGELEAPAPFNLVGGYLSYKDETSGYCMPVDFAGEILKRYEERSKKADYLKSERHLKYVVWFVFIKKLLKEGGTINTKALGVKYAPSPYGSCIGEPVRIVEFIRMSKDQLVKFIEGLEDQLPELLKGSQRDLKVMSFEINSFINMYNSEKR